MDEATSAASYLINRSTYISLGKKTLVEVGLVLQLIIHKRKFFVVVVVPETEDTVEFVFGGGC